MIGVDLQRMCGCGGEFKFMVRQTSELLLVFLHDFVCVCVYMCVLFLFHRCDVLFTFYFFVLYYSGPTHIYN